MPTIRLLFLWHMHQPYYKDLVTGEYRLPWVRLHALKDYYGMVKLLEEFPDVHQTFNLVPSLVAQIQDYVAGAANDPFFAIAAHPAYELDFAEKLFAIQYLFQANLDKMIGRYPRYRELWQRFRSRPEEAARLVPQLSNSDVTDLQVLSQIAWMDEFFLEDPDVRELVKKGRAFTLEDQELVMKKEREFLGKVLPAYAAAAKRGTIEISTSPYYHPILPLVCDTDEGAAAHHGLPLPEQRFRRPEDAREQIVRGMNLHEKAFGVRPRGMWPSEGSVSDEALKLAHDAGLKWVATDEGVLGRSLGYLFERDDRGRLLAEPAEKLYRFYRWEQGDAEMNMIFRNHSLSDLIGFVYSGMPAREAAEDFIDRIRFTAGPILEKGKDAVVSVILDGENAWETYPQSGREFLRRLYDAIENDPQFEALTVSEAMEREEPTEVLESIFPGSWINANFDVWIGAEEDNIAWDYLFDAREFYARHAQQAPEPQRNLAYEELLIAEGSDWNWWYGPEHHSENDSDFDDLFRKHLSNVYHALGAAPPDALAQPITARHAKPQFTAQTAYIHPRVDGRNLGYFDWLGAATHVADRHSASMHGKLFLLDTGYAGIDEDNLYCRMDFMEVPAEWAGAESTLLLTIETVAADGQPDLVYRLEAVIVEGKLREFRFGETGEQKSGQAGVEVALDSIFECKIPLALLNASEGTTLRVRFSVWRDRLPLDALPQEGAIDLRVVPEIELTALPYAKP